MDPYRVLLAEQFGEKATIYFDCMAEDTDHAVKQALNAYPGGEVRSTTQFSGNLMPSCWRRKLAVGETVYWHDPDNGFGSGWYRVKAADGGFPICNDDDILMLVNDQGSEVEAFAHELEQSNLLASEGEEVALDEAVAA